MTVRINKPALNLREELTKAQGVVRYEQRQFWMDGLVENGTFDNDISGWTATTATLSWDSSGYLAINSAGGGEGAYQGFSTVVGKRYKLVFDIVSDGGTYHGVRIGNNSIGVINTFISTLGAGLNNTLYFNAQHETSVVYLRAEGAGIATWDNIQVFEVDENDNVIHSVPLGFKPVHVYEDGLLQREGENHDYTVTDTGFGYQIKPTVAPTGSTETCVIAEREL